MNGQLELMVSLLEISGTVSFALSGVLTSAKRKFDLLGVVTVGIITAVGGGIMRDALIGVKPVSALSNPIYILIATMVSVVAFVILKLVHSMSERAYRVYDRIMLVSDTLGLGIFTVTGISVAMQNGFTKDYFILAFSGIVTGVGGGVIRDIIVNKRPEIFVSNVYACASLLGAVSFLVLYNHCAFAVTCGVSLSLTFVLRVCSAGFGWNLPKIVLPVEMKKHNE